ncbi:helix-turn-helix domain-containing protein [Chryseolinea soli]|uniref:LuxR family transcriptional regulator n=1 Tax=Chryseolinea soli TaxID=2321403 RepID=A0A385SPB5_9BACT|nr:helix-turn-helix transcriptional regulator [Chryseolinea soli]AYB32854.1 LuxR family transcriptional regulator [Chryseolinea soli]
MAIRLFVNFLDKENRLVEKVDFFCLSGKPCCDDLELIKKIAEVLTTLKSHVLSTDIFIEAKLDDPQLALHKLRKQVRYETSVYQEKLSSREVEVLSLIMQGLTNKDISERLFISFETVRSHRKSILKKIGVKNTAALVSYYNQAFFDHTD